MNRLVVVESPTKARTIRNFLPKEYQVEASMGHIRDLPASASEIPEGLRDESWARLGVNVTDSFEPIYVIPSDKQKVVRQLRSALKSAEELYIATDEDREGESIGWHLVEVLAPNVPVRRMVFHEITREAIQRALDETRAIDQSLVDAQETRRILDRLVGYSLSPLLWKKIAPRLSAGRVQSVAVRVLVMRERERMAFVPAKYFDLKAELDKKGAPFEAVMTHLSGVRLATGKDFDDNTGRLKESLTPGEDVLLWSEEDAQQLAARLPDEPWSVVNIDDRISTRSPYAPFITSTLQQEANRKLNLTARRTMQVAQRLYENGYITYMRTDSTQLSKEAVMGSRRAVEQRYGKDYLSPKPKQYYSKVANAQEAHEAIRPAGSSMKTMDELRLTGIEGALYDLIWKRTVASQMADARLRLITAHIEAGTDEIARFRASGRTVEFPGFFRAYVEGTDDPEAALENRDQPLPDLSEGDRPGCTSVDVSSHETKPPARYTEATLVRVLEQEGIGRPSTYASIIDTIVGRGYVMKKGSQLIPTFTAFAANNLLEEQFEQLVDVGFTAEMEQILDDIAAGDQKATPYLKSFFLGKEGLESKVEAGLDKIDARKVSTIESPKWNGYVVRVGKYGPYVEGELDGERATASIPDELAPGDILLEELKELLEAGNAADRVLGKHPDTGMDVLVRKGPYGPYVQLGHEDDQKGKPKRISLPKGMQPEEVDRGTAVDLLALPRTLGEHPESGKPIKANIGRYGPYVQHERTYASLKSDDDVLTVDLDRALTLLAEKSKRSGALRTVGDHPESGEPIEVWKGRYGPYVKYQKTNASLPKDTEPEDVTLDLALELIEKKQKKKGGGRRKTK